MKQNPPIAKLESSLAALVIIGVALFASACATLPLHPASKVQLIPDPPKAQRASQININQATAQELETLPGIGKGIAERIVAHREQYGHFRRVEHLLIVRGISDRKFRAIQPMIVVD